MKRQHLTSLVVVGALLLLAAWIMRNTYWDDITLPTTLRGEAARYPMYAAESFARKLGARTSRDSVFSNPGTNDIIYLSDWSWDLGANRRHQLERWVNAGGRLVIDDSVYFRDEIFESWSGIEYFDPDVSDEERERRAGDEVGNCEDWQQSKSSPIAGDPVDRTYQVCNQYGWQRLRASRLVNWSLHDRDGVLALRVAQGRGSVTVINAQPFTWRQFLEGDHAELFVAVTGLHGGDHIHFLSEAEHPSLLALAWRYGSPAIVLGCLALALSLWRNGTRFGPIVPAALPLRRSLVEQIRGTGEFALRHGGGRALQAACVRATRSAAAKHIPGFASMSATEQIAAMADAGGTSTEVLAHALVPAQHARPNSLLSTLALLETVRRRILSRNSRQSHGN